MPMTQEEFAQTDGFECPNCCKRNTAKQTDNPKHSCEEVYWWYECHDCGAQYKIFFKPAEYQLVMPEEKS